MDALEKKALEIKTGADTDLHKAADLLLQFTRRFSNNLEIKRKALKLNLTLNTLDIHPQGDEQRSLQRDIQATVDQVVAEFASNPDEIEAYVSGKELIRSIFQEQARAQELVFEGKHISYRYGDKGFFLVPFDLRLATGEITAVVGENGSGKSTLIKIVAGEHMPPSGRISYPLFSDPELDWMRVKEQIAYIPQRLEGWAGTVSEYLHFSAAVKGLRGRRNKDEVEYIMHRLGLAKLKHTRWNELSGGGQMRVELARVLVWKPKLLILDEPLANLDINMQAIFLRDLQDMAYSYNHPISVLITSQHLYEIENISDNILFLKGGKVIYNGATKSFGEDRRKNLFEFNSNAGLNELRLALTGRGLKGIYSHGQNFVIEAGLDMDAKTVLKVLAETAPDIEIRYFRDISRSTRVLFE